MPIIITSILTLALLGQADATEPEHAANPVLKSVLECGLCSERIKSPLPSPLLHDKQSADEQRAVLKEIVGSDRDVEELLRNSVTAPFRIKVSKADYPEGAVGIADLWFVVHAELAEINLEDIFGSAKKEGAKEGATEVSNLRFEGRLIPDAALAARNLKPTDKFDRYSQARGLLLDKVGFEATNRTVATRSSESLVVASQTIARFDSDAEFPNASWLVDRMTGKELKDTRRAYPGWSGYAKVSRFKGQAGSLIVEMHIAYAEPTFWFNGAPLLRSKISLVAQDRVRNLRREIAKRRVQGKP